MSKNKNNININNNNLLFITNLLTNNKNNKRGITMCQENVGSSEMRGGMTMFRSLHLKMTDNKFLWHFSVRKDK